PNMDTLPTLNVGYFVETHIKAKPLEDVVRLDGDHIRQGGTVWVTVNNKLSIENVAITYQDPDYAYIRSGIADNAQIVTTDLSTVVDGADLRTETQGRPVEDLGEGRGVGEN